LIHSGSAEIEPGKQSALERFVFCGRNVGAHLNRVEGSMLNGERHYFLLLKADRFSETMFQAAEEWDAAITNDAKIQLEKRKLLVIHEVPFMIGNNAVYVS